ncbi:hypothetical protein DFH09DRAFT_1142887 [Mycena vulgaris]|nr:hypothetical protein DFH09DRAFT_1142887 [Mycena vulgaris]
MDQCEAAVPELINLTIEQLTRTPEVHAYETMPRAMEGFREDITTLQPSVFIDCSNAPTGAHSKLLKALLDERNPARSSFPLRRSHSLPEAWRVSAFIVFDKPSPPSPTPAPKPKANNVYLHSTAMSSAESLAAPPQSGHSYLRSIKPLKNKVKTKTRPDTANVRSVVPPVKAVPLTRTYTGTMKKTSFMSRLRNRDGADDEDKPKAAPKPAGKWFNKLSTMSKTTAERMRVLVKGAPNARELSWKDFLKIMKELGFTWEEMDGTAIKFLPPDPRDPVRP